MTFALPDNATVNRTWVIFSACNHLSNDLYFGIDYLLQRYSMNRSVASLLIRNRVKLTSYATSAHSKFTKSVHPSCPPDYLSYIGVTFRLYKTVFPHGLDGYKTPAASPAVSRKSSNPSLKSVSTTGTATPTKSFFGRWAGSALTAPPPQPVVSVLPDGPVEDMIVAGTAFGMHAFTSLNMAATDLNNQCRLWAFQPCFLPSSGPRPVWVVFSADGDVGLTTPLGTS